MHNTKNKSHSGNKMLFTPLCDCYLSVTVKTEVFKNNDACLVKTHILYRQTSMFIPVCACYVLFTVTVLLKIDVN